MARGRRKSISAKPEHTGGLSRATRQIHGLLEELTETVESAERLARDGEAERAIRLVEEQRESLYSTVDSISRDVSTKPSRLEKLRTRAPILVAAALFAVSVLAISVGAITAPRTTPAQDRLRRAEGITDPATRMTAIYNAYRDVATTTPAMVAPGTPLNHEVTKALTKTKKDMQGDPGKTALVDQARALIDAVSSGQAPPPPPPPPAPTPSAPAPSAPAPPSGTGSDVPPLP